MEAPPEAGFDPSEDEGQQKCMKDSVSVVVVIDDVEITVIDDVEITIIDVVVVGCYRLLLLMLL